ncbi:MAG: hypothetical protein H6718_34345 [Polyangiaceae bacterium]|nr:hypothetical protein [Polyangiaceae bacterium]MCB9608536.1 hypothetical protein [Polyangiaceae bacterium]
MKRRTYGSLTSVLIGLSSVACAGPSPKGEAATGGAAGSSGSASQGGTSGVGADGGSGAGGAGAGGAGAGGTTVGGTGGTATAGNSGTGAAGGVAGSAGSGGSSGGAAGSSGGSAGSSGAAGASGAAGVGGTGGAATCSPPCGAHGSCDTTSTPVCVCESNYEGATCEACKSGFQDHDRNGTCEVACTVGACVTGGFCQDASGTLACVYPGSCAALKALNPAAGDGEHQLFVGNDPQKPAQIFCNDMAGTPLEYLTLINPNTFTNDYSNTPAPTQVVTYTKIRVDLATLKVGIEDPTFASSDTASPVTPYATITSCHSNTGAGVVGSGVADIRGTQFAFDDTFTNFGFCSSGGGSFTDNFQRFEFTADGQCGSYGPSELANEIGDSCFNIPATPDGERNFVLQLKYFP